MWDQFENKFKVQFLCAKDEILNLEPGCGITQSSKCLAAGGKFWWLKLRKYTLNLNMTDYIGVYLCAAVGDPNVVVDVDTNFRLVAKCRSWNIECTGRRLTFRRLWGCKEFVRVSTLISDESKFCCDGQFVFEVDVTVLSIDDVPIPQPPVISFREIVDSPVSKPTTTISKILFSNGEDIIVVSKCGVEFACHTYILATNELFEKLILKTEEEAEGSTPAKKSKGEPRRVVLQEMSADVLRVVLSHIYQYHGSLRFDISIAGDVLNAAEFFNLPLLKRECEVVLSHNLDVDDFLDSLMLAELTNSKMLKDACLSFWAKHGLDIMKTEEWDKFMDSKDAKNKILYRNLCEHLLLQNNYTK